MDSIRIKIVLARSEFDSAKWIWIGQRCNKSVKTLLERSDKREFVLCRGESCGRVVRQLAVFAIEKIAHRFAASGVRTFVGLQRVGGFRCSAGGIFFTALGTAVGETRLSRFEFEFFAASYANFDWVCHVRDRAKLYKVTEKS